MEKIVFLEWKSFGNEFLIAELKKNGYEIERFPFPRETEDVRNSSVLAEEIAKRILSVQPAFVFSFNYFPVAAIACQACKTKYVSWVYDSPYIHLYSQTINYDTNRVFVFDSVEVERLRALGARTVRYLAMGAAVDAYDRMQPDEQMHKRYDSDITFIGSMYSEQKQNMFRHLEEVDAYTKGYLDSMMQIQKFLYGIDVLEPALTPQIMDAIKRVCPIEAHGDGLETDTWILANYFLARRVTALERRELLEALSHKYRVRLYTPEATPFLPGVENGGRIDYYDEAPLAMKCAKINLNISLRSIHAGIPLRAMDIMGCGGFLISNFQADFARHFVAGEDYVYYEDKDDLMELAAYYLEHDEERLRIARNGYRKVKEQLSCEIQVKEMLASVR